MASSICAAVVAAPVAGEHLCTVDDAYLVRIGEYGQDPPDTGIRHRIVVQVEADIRRLTNRHRDTPTCSSTGSGLFGTASRRGLSSSDTARTVRSGWSGQRRSAASPVHQAVAWALRSSRSVKVHAAKNASRTYRMALSTRPFSFAACYRYWAWFVTIVSGKAQQGRMEAARIAAPFQHGALEIVVEQDTRHAAPGGRTRRHGHAGSSPLHAGIEKKA
jgi:hypothetical protein